MDNMMDGQEAQNETNHNSYKIWWTSLFTHLSLSLKVQSCPIYAFLDLFEAFSAKQHNTKHSREFCFKTITVL